MTTTVAWSRAPVPEAASILEEAGFPPWQAGLLARRGVEGTSQAQAFLTPSLDQLHDPMTLHGMDRAIERLLTLREQEGRVALVGDYDVDGVSGTALLLAVLKYCGLDPHPILPHRLRDGYGFQASHVQQAVDLKCELIITVDCGTNSHEAVRAALDAGLGVVVTDHHLPDGVPAEDVILINPRQPACSYPFVELCGAGLALKLALALLSACGKELDPRRLIRIACLGTVADLVPLVDENRAIAALGLEELARTRSAGLQALIRVARLKRPYSTEDIGFRLGPRLNAPGRLDSAQVALDLLLCRDPAEAEQLADQLDRWNRERQGVERRTAEEARELFRARDPRPGILVGWSDSWHRGVVGVAAGRLAREFHRPVVLLACDGETATGSGRSVADIHLHDFLAEDRDRLTKFGGHAQAIGLTVPVERLEELREHWEKRAEPFLEPLSVKTYEYELDLEPRQLDMDLVQGLHRMQPFGQANPSPLMRVRGPLRLVRPPRHFGNGHLSAAAQDAYGGRIRLMGWGWQERSEDLEGQFEVLGRLERDPYAGGHRIQLVDCRPWQPDQNLPT